MTTELDQKLREINRQITWRYYTRIWRYTVRRWLTPVAYVAHKLADLIPTRRRDLTGVLSKYEKMAGEYISINKRAVEQPYNVLVLEQGKPALVPAARFYDMMAEYVAENVFRSHGKLNSVLEVGVGEYTTLTAAVKKAGYQPERIVGLDISWSRLRVGENYARENGVKIERSVVGNIFTLPFLPDSFDVVYTHYCIEQSPFDNEKVLKELYRVARSRVVIMEPAYELGSVIQKRRMLTEDYVRGLPRSLERLGYRVTRYEQLPIGTYHNNGALWIIEKNAQASRELASSYLACPACGEALEEIHQQLFCRKMGVVYPVLNGIACLQPHHAILATKFDAA